jgi:hypothetical protein
MDRVWGRQKQRVSYEQWSAYDSWRAPYLNLKLAIESGHGPQLHDLPSEPLLDYLGRSWWAGTYFEQTTGHSFDKFVDSPLVLSFASISPALVEAKRRLVDHQPHDFEQVLALLESDAAMAYGWDQVHHDGTLWLSRFHEYVRGALRLYGHPLGTKTARNLLIRILIDADMQPHHVALLNDFFLPDLRSSCVVRMPDGSITQIRQMDESAWTIPRYREESHRG